MEVGLLWGSSSGGGSGDASEGVVDISALGVALAAALIVIQAAVSLRCAWFSLCMSHTTHLVF